MHKAAKPTSNQKVFPSHRRAKHPTLARRSKKSRPISTSRARQFSTTQLNSSEPPPKKKQGSIHLIVGPMFSGKTTVLLNMYRESMQLGHKSLLIKHSSDTRYHGQTQVVSHTNERETAVSTHFLADDHIAPLVKDHSLIFIDEGQFFPDLPVVADNFANDGKVVFIAALDGTFQREPFAPIAALVPKVDTITKLLAQCHTCGESAPFSKRISADKEVHVVGGADKYQAACREHFFSPAVI